MQVSEKMAAPKILSFDEAPAIMQELRAQGRKIVQCHGTFDLVHPGHVCHLQEAHDLGDILVVTVTAAKHVNKGPGRPYFDDQTRARSLAALTCVDYVVLTPFPAAVEAIECIRPDIYCKGKEYQDAVNDVTGNINDDVRAVEALGGEVRFLGSVVFSSTRLLNQHFDHLDAPVKEFCRTLGAEFSPQDLREAVDGLADLKVLVIGDTIFDRYSSVQVQGLTSKNRIISGRFLQEETQTGGALAVFRHVKQFTDNVKFISLVGTEPWVDSILSTHVPAGQDMILREEIFTTIIKQRFVETLNAGKELSKLFSVNYIDADPPSPAVQARVLTRIASEIAEADAVLLLDFGHGLLQPAIREFIQESSPFLALNCQTNSNNHGFNIISRQYQRADAFCLDQQELMLSCGHRHFDFASELEGLRRQLRSEYAWLTRGAVQTIGLAQSQPACVCPPLENEVTDTVGAGDAFFSITSLAAARRLPVSIATFLGQLAGAQAVKIVGNSQPISKQTLLKSGMALLNF
jgi:rfaE bifunctional protein nucleotidyltransferase chain/domain